jgi:DNA-binding GntR family transcriptional regulator
MSIASYITDDIKRRIQAGETLPSNLTLADLSRYYDVSITPVRGAIQSLVDEGYLQKSTTRRIEVNEDMIGIGGDVEIAERPKRPQDWDEILLDEVMHASLSLASFYLREGALAQKHGVGRSIIRSAFSRFAGAGLLEHVPRRGWRVHPVRIEDADAFLAVRESLELLALESAWPRIERADVMALLDGEQSHALNDATHWYFIERAHNRYITAFFGQFVTRFYRKLFYYAAPEAEVVAEMTQEHVHFLQAILDGDRDRARAELSRHILGQKAVLDRILLRGEHVPDTQP